MSIFRIFAIALIFVVVIVLLQWDMERIAQNAVTRHEQSEAVYWKARLHPSYQATGIHEKENPQTVREAIDPLLESFLNLNDKITTQPK